MVQPRQLYGPRWRVLVLGIAGAVTGGALLACGGESPPVDAFDGPCWPLPSTPGGEVTMGTGELTFEPMPEVVPIVFDDSQGDPYIRVQALMRGMPPGDPSDPFAPENPRTKVTAVIEELGLTLGLECPSSLGYVEASEAGAFHLPRARRIGFGTVAGAQEAAGRPVTITVEVVGGGLYAKDERDLVLGTVPLPDAGVDAGVDAAIDAE